MHYGEGAFWRPLFEDRMVPLQVATGCSHNRCKFCDMYHEPFAPAPREEIMQDIREIARTSAIRPRVFLTGGNALCLPMGDLRFALEELEGALGGTADVGAFARVTDVARKSDDDLRELARLGVDDISIGAESGYGPALEAMDKGYRAQDIVEQCQRLDAAGMRYSLFYLLGMGGRGCASASAQATARVFGQTHPARIMLHTMTPFRGTPLWDEIESGTFEPAGEIEVIAELREFVEAADMDTFVLGNHFANVARISGRIPQDRAKMLEYLDWLVANADEDRMRRFRASIPSI